MENKDKIEFSKEKFSEIMDKLHANPDTICQLNDWAHSGTEESMAKLKEFIEDEKNKDLRGYAECAFEECEYFYYCTNNAQEESDFLLAKMIRQKEEHIFDLEMEADTVKLKLEKLALDKKVHLQVIKNLDKKQAEEWKYNFSEDNALCVRNDMAKIENEIAYLGAWVEQARKMIKAKRFKTIPDEVIDHIHLTADDEDFCDEKMQRDCSLGEM